MQRFAQTLLVLAGLGFLAFGAAILVAPAEVLGRVGITGSAAGLVELQAFYGGLELGLGGFLLAAGFVAGWRRPGLWVVALANGGIGLARLVGIAGSGEFTPFFGWALAWEFGFALLAALALAGTRGEAAGR